MRRDRISSVPVSFMAVSFVAESFIAMSFPASRSWSRSRRDRTAGTRARPTRRTPARRAAGTAARSQASPSPAPRAPAGRRPARAGSTSRCLLSTSATSSPIFARWYRSARNPTFGAPALLDHREGLAAGVDGETRDVHGVDRLDEHRRPGLRRRLAPRTPGSRSRPRPAPRPGTPGTRSPYGAFSRVHPVRPAISTAASNILPELARRARGATRSRAPRPPCPRHGSSAKPGQPRPRRSTRRTRRPRRRTAPWPPRATRIQPRGTPRPSRRRPAERAAAR